MFEIHVGELRATFLRNHNMRHHKDPSGRQPKQKTPTSPATTTGPGSTSLVQQAEDAHIPGNHHNCQKHRGTAPDKGHCTRYVALHPLCGGAPVMWRCTRTEEVDCLRIGCSAPTHKNKRGTGTPNHSPPHPSMRSWALLAAGWARHHLHPGPLRHLLHPYMRRAGKPHPDGTLLSFSYGNIVRGSSMSMR